MKKSYELDHLFESKNFFSCESQYNVHVVRKSDNTFIASISQKFLSELSEEEASDLIEKVVSAICGDAYSPDGYLAPRTAEQWCGRKYH